MKRYIPLLLGCLLSASSSFAAEEDWSVYTRLDSFVFSDGYSVKGLFNNLEGDFKPGKTSFTFNKLEAGITKGRWELSVFSRYDYFLEYSEDTSLFIYQSERDLALTEGRDYELELDVVHFKGRGLALAYFWNVNDQLWIKPKLNLLLGDKLMDGHIFGQTNIRSGDVANSEIEVDYHYSKDVLFDRDVNAPSAEGMSADLEIGWQLSSQVKIHLSAQDLVSHIVWDEAPRTVASGSTNNVSLTPEGQLEAVAVLSGNESNQRFVQNLPVRTTVSAIWDFRPDVSAFGEVFSVGETLMPRLGVGWHYAPSGYLSMKYDFEADAIGLGGAYKGFGFYIFGDDPDLEKANTLSLRLTAGFSF